MSGYGGGYGQGGYGSGGYGQQGGYSAGGYGNNRYEAPSQNPYGQAAGNPYGGGNTGYGQQNQYGQQQQAYDPPRPAQTNPYGQQSSYTGGGYPQQAPEPQQQTGYTDVEMGQVNRAGNRGPKTPEQIRDNCKYLDGEVDKVNADISKLKSLHARSKDAVDTNPATNQTLRQIDDLSADILKQTREATVYLRTLKGEQQAGNEMVAPQIHRLDGKLRKTISDFQQEDSTYQKALREQLKRQYRIVRPDATETEVEEAAQEQNTQIFSQALLQSDRRGQAQSALSAVKGRHAAIQKIEQDMIQLTQLFEDLNNIIIQQEAQVQNIDQQATAVEQDVSQANVQLDGAVKKARAARKKKWICLGIVVAIILIIVIVVLAWGFGTGHFSSGGSNGNNGNKTS